MQAPAKMEKPIGIPRMPTPTGSCPYTLNACVGQNMRMEKKLAPLMKVMTNVNPRMRGSFLRPGKSSVSYSIAGTSIITYASGTWDEERTSPK